MSGRRWLSLATALLLAVAACGGDEELEEEEIPPNDLETLTELETVDPSTTTPPPTPTAAAVEVAHSGPSFVVLPPEPVTETLPAQGGAKARFEVPGTVDDERLPDTLTVAFYPCEFVTLSAATPPLHPDDADVDDNGEADGTGETDTSHAVISTVNGEPFDPRPEPGKQEWVATAVETPAGS